MIIKPLYKVIRPTDGGIDISPEMPTGMQYEDGGVRLIAEEGMILYKDGEYFYCIDTDSAEGWIELVDPTPPEPQPEPPEGE